MSISFRKKHGRLIAALSVFALLLILTGLALYADLKTTDYDVTDPRIPEAFDGFKIAHISDLHCEWFGEGQSEILNAVRAGEPDIIVLTGDIIDARNPDYESIAVLFDGLGDIAPVYAVSGNHEQSRSVDQAKMAGLYAEYGINYLKDTGTAISIKGSSIFLYGLNDRVNLDSTKTKIPAIGEDSYGILLFHRAGKFDDLTDCGFGLVLAGHLHGGLIRIPFVGGIVTAEGEIDFNQKYEGGMYTVNKTTLISSKGLAPSHGVPRIFNRPEVVFVTLHHQGN
ncbi:MAG: metallophosphoesterase [Clostridiales bacterium]|nr:metallophosphoesterase [Clostridiales bacterium]